MPTLKSPKVEQRNHPFGEAGITSSLEEVARRVAAGGLRADIRAWAIECLERARRAGRPVKKPRDRARELLKAVQKKLWVPDPIGTEFMAGAHLTACTDKDSLCFHGGDCDDLVVLLGSAFNSVGLYTMVVGHAYDEQKRIQHVLTAVHVDGRWLYADPSTELNLGECMKFSREKILSTPNIQTLCDAGSCLVPGKFDPSVVQFEDKPRFVGVDGVPYDPSFAAGPPDVVPQGYEAYYPPTPAQQPNKMSFGEKIMLASVVISGASFAWNVSRST